MGGTTTRIGALIHSENGFVLAADSSENRPNVTPLAMKQFVQVRYEREEEEGKRDRPQAGHPWWVEVDETRTEYVTDFRVS